MLRALTCLAIASLLLGGCSSTSKPSTDAATIGDATSDGDATTDGGTITDGHATPLRLATYNAGLAVGFVAHADQRTEPVARAVGQLDVDLLCIQEAWEQEHWDAIAKAATQLPSRVRLDAMPGTTAVGPACTEQEIGPLRACVEKSCADASVDELVGCATQGCPAEVGALSKGCIGCVAANLGSTFDEIAKTCTTESSGSYAYDGSFGIGILTSGKITDQAHEVLDASLNRRAIIYAKVEFAGFGQAHVFCTHLTSVFSSIPYPGEGSWEKEQAAQIDVLLKMIASRAGDEPVFLLGDLNNGPAVAAAGTKAEGEANYKKLVDAGLTNGYVDSPDAQCTFCADNPLVGGADDTESVVIDHVLYRNVEGTVKYQRILDDPIEITTSDGKATTALSDHYGLQATVE